MHMLPLVLLSVGLGRLWSSVGGRTPPDLADLTDLTPQDLFSVFGKLLQPKINWLIGCQYHFCKVGFNICEMEIEIAYIINVGDVLYRH